MVTDAGAHYMNANLTRFLADPQQHRASFRFTDIYHYEAGEGTPTFVVLNLFIEWLTIATHGCIQGKAVLTGILLFSRTP